MNKTEAVEVLKDKAFVFCEIEACDWECDKCHEALNMAIEALEQIESGRYVKGECNRCHKEYGTLGCCTTVSNHWVYSCKEGMAQYAEALEQEPCEDAVSRKALLDKAYAYGNGLEPEGYCVDVEDVQALPSVAPARKKGKWIVYPLLDEGRVKLVCPICEDTFISAVDYKPHFCENCGARMESDEE